MKVNIIWFVAIFCLAVTILDIAVVETIYRPNELWDKIGDYHRTLLILVIVTPLYAAALSNSLVPLTSWLFFLFGLEDTLFYALQGYLPEIYYGVSVMGFWEPTLGTVLILNVLGLALMAALNIFLYKKG